MLSSKHLLTLVIACAPLASLLGCSQPTNRDGSVLALNPPVLRKVANANIRGIYLQQTFMENRFAVEDLARKAQHIGINAFVVELKGITKEYEKNLIILRNRGIKFIPHIRIYSLNSEVYSHSMLRLLKLANNLGAHKIHLEYPPLLQDNEADIIKSYRWYQNQLQMARIERFNHLDNSKVIEIPTYTKEISVHKFTEYLNISLENIEANKDSEMYFWNIDGNYSKIFEQLIHS